MTDRVLLPNSAKFGVLECLGLFWDKTAGIAAINLHGWRCYHSSLVGCDAFTVKTVNCDMSTIKGAFFWNYSGIGIAEGFTATLGIRVARERTIVWLIPTISIPEY